MTAPGRPIPLLAFAAFLVLAVALVWAMPYPSHFDELEHVSYAAYLQETRQWRPMFEAMHSLKIDSLLDWNDRANYLGHPAPFYWYETLFLDRTLPLHAGVVRVRLASAALVAIGTALALAAGWRVFARDRLALALFCALVALCPKLLAVTFQVSNDALALLAGGLGYWGVITEPRRRASGLFACGLALMLALWAKPNAALAIGAVLGLHALLRLRECPALIPTLALGAALGAVPYGPILAKYAKLVPITVEQFGNVQSVPGLANYLPAFLFNVAYTFCFDQTGAWPIPGLGAVLVVVLVWLLLAAAALGGILAIGRAGDPARSAAIAGPLALLAVMPIHFWFSATQLAGSLPAASFRYYLPIWPFLAHAIAVATTTAPRTRLTITALTLATLTLTWTSP